MIRMSYGASRPIMLIERPEKTKLSFPGLIEPKKKEMAEEQSKDKPETNDSSEVMAKKRGRPKKVPTDEPAKPKNPVGRPRKII